MKALTVAGVLCTLCGCVRGPMAATPPPSPPPLTGLSTLNVEASSVCNLSVSKYAWDVEGTATGTQTGAGVRATLPGGDNTVDVSITYSSASLVTGSISARTAPFGDVLRVSITSTARGTLSKAPDGRGQVMDGVLNGTIALSNAGDRDSASLGSCTAANHKWTLLPRAAPAAAIF